MSWIIAAVLPFVAIILGLFSVMAELVVGVIGWVSFVVALYLLMKRRNKHLRRAGDLFEELIRVARDKEAEKGDSASSMAECNRLLSQFRYGFKERSAVVWAIISIGAFYYLLRFHEHVSLENSFFKEADNLYEQLSLKKPSKAYLPHLPVRHFWRLLVLGVITSGLSHIYTLYVMIKDQSSHYEEHYAYENSVFAPLEEG